MTANPRATLRTAALAFAGADLFGSVVAMRDEVPGRPLGIGVPFSVPVGLLIGWGAGIAAPWPMSAAALLAARADRRSERTGPALVVAAIGLGCIVGTMVEPVTYRPRSWTWATGTAIFLNLTASGVAVAAGLRRRGTLRESSTAM